MNELDLLEKRIDTLLDWKRNLERERLKYPLDFNSRKILKDLNVPYFNGVLGEDVSALGTDFLCFGMEFKVKGGYRVIFASYRLKQFSVDDVNTDVLNSTGHRLVNGNRIVVTSSNTLPDPLSTVGIYYIINATTNSFQISETEGGSAVDITTNGNGNHYFAKLS